MKKSPRFEIVQLCEPVIRRNREVKKYSLDFHTINLKKVARRHAIQAEKLNRTFGAAANFESVIDYRLLAFDLFNRASIREEGRIYRIVTKSVYEKIIARIKSYFTSAQKQYKAGYQERPCFLI